MNKTYLFDTNWCKLPKQVSRLLIQMMSWSKVATIIESQMLLTKCQYNQTIHRFTVFRHVNHRNDSWKLDGDHHHFYDKFMCFWDLTFFSSSKIYILFSCVLFYTTFSRVLSHVPRTRSPQFPCILKLQTPGCSHNSLTSNEVMRCQKPEDHSVLINKFPVLFLFNTLLLMK